MNDPVRDGVSYDYNSSAVASADVHYGSGVPNLAFYLLSAGGTHPRGRSTTAVTGIGADDAGDIWYLALSNYMTASTNFAGARAATLSAAAALFGTASQQYTSVGNAWTAVGVGAAAPATCTTTNYSGTITRAGRSAYAPSSSGTTAAAGTHTITMTGPSAGNFDLYLQKRSGRSWTTVASSTASTSTESLSYAGTSGTYRAVATSRTGTGSYAIGWCKP
jgi:vibriolysin